MQPARVDMPDVLHLVWLFELPYVVAVWRLGRAGERQFATHKKGGGQHLIDVKESGVNVTTPGPTVPPRTPLQQTCNSPHQACPHHISAAKHS